MKNTKNRVVGLSLVTALLLGTSAYAGKVKTDAPEGEALKTAIGDGIKQFGFGGWDYSNIAVKIVDMSDFNTSLPGSLFNTDTGNYTPMGPDMSFESEITTDGELRGKLHGKDWPVGEPSGIKVINGDESKHGKPENCIMTSSYLDTGYLDTATKNPVLCSSDFQSHKRFKVNLLPTTVDNIISGTAGWGEPVDLKFNLVPGDTTELRYQILQKINNYTGKRLDGYKVEVLDENNIINSALNMSIGIGEGDEGGNIWDPEDMANFSHGLWGPTDDHFPEPGFFDNVRAYYTPVLASNMILYDGSMLGGNYGDIFGNWLPSSWQPEGIFFDHDDNPETDALLKAFWGTIPGAPAGTANAWHKGKIDNWENPTDTEFLQWLTDPAYDQEGIEDTLNLGLNYIVKIGSNDAIGSTFTLRMTPHIAADQTPPSYVDNSAPDKPVIPIPPIEEEITDGTIAISPAPTFIIGDTLILSVKDEDQNKNASVKDTTTVTITTDTGDKETATLTETDVNSAIFMTTIASTLTTSAPAIGDGKMNVIKDSVVTVTYADNTHNTSASTTATIPSIDSDDALDSSGDTASSGGGGCTSNPNGKSFDMMFLFMMALGLLYPFRRRFIK